MPEEFKPPPQGVCRAVPEAAQALTGGLMQEEQLLEIQQLSEKMVRQMRFNLHANAATDEQGVLLKFSGPDVDLLLQRNATVLYALEYVLNRMCSGILGKDRKITADAGDFRALRAEELQLMAVKASEKVLAYGRPVDLQPMPAHERRIIHLALQDQPKVRTVSEGTGEERKVIIMPA
jgi:spoIIIJ-associated protein